MTQTVIFLPDNPEYAGHLAIDGPGGSLSYSNLSKRLAQPVTYLEPGSRVRIMADTTSETVDALLRCWRAGAVPVPINPKWPQNRVDQMTAHIQPVVPLTDTVSPVKNCCPAVEPVNIDLSADATIIFTSGSSGEPKAALHSYGNHYFNALGANQIIPLCPGDRWLLSLPLYHVGGLAILFRCMLAGATVVLPSERSLGEQICSGRITHLSCVPTQLQRLLAEAVDLSSLKALLVGGGIVSPDLFNEAMARGIPVYQTYGCTEMSSQVCTGRSAEHAGRLLPYRDIHIDESGEILVKGDTLFKGYLMDGELDPARDSAGWFHTGDLGQLKGGVLEVVGRKDNMFISGGENIQPEEIERALLALGGIDSAIVVSRRDAEYGMRPVAFLAGSWSDVEIREMLRNILPSYMIPDQFLEMPITTGLKPSRSELRNHACISKS